MLLRVSSSPDYKNEHEIIQKFSHINKILFRINCFCFFSDKTRKTQFTVHCIPAIRSDQNCWKQMKGKQQIIENKSRIWCFITWNWYFLQLYWRER